MADYYAFFSNRWNEQDGLPTSASMVPPVTLPFSISTNLVPFSGADPLNEPSAPTSALITA